jgi:hypothetical protein
MSHVFDPEQTDLAEIAALLRHRCGPAVEGLVVGRTRLRDEVVRHLDCSQLEGEIVIDTMIGRGLLVWHERPGELAEWIVRG